MKKLWEIIALLTATVWLAALLIISYFSVKEDEFSGDEAEEED